MDDASTRQDKSRTLGPGHIPAALSGTFHPGALSGYNTNTDKAVYTTPHLSFKTGHNEKLGIDPSTLSHPLLAKRYMHKHKLDYMATIRPDCETTNQTQR